MCMCDCVWVVCVCACVTVCGRYVCVHTIASAAIISYTLCLPQAHPVACLVCNAQGGLWNLHVDEGLDLRCSLLQKHHHAASIHSSLVQLHGVTPGGVGQDHVCHPYCKVVLLLTQ